MLLGGSDLVESFHKPGVWIPEHVTEILKDFGVVCVSREGSSAVNSVDDSIPGQSDPMPEVNFVSGAEFFGVSSTKVRRAVAANADIKGLVTEEVEEYIRKNGLYRGFR